MENQPPDAGLIPRECASPACALYEYEGRWHDGELLVLFDHSKAPFCGAEKAASENGVCLFGFAARMQPPADWARPYNSGAPEGWRRSVLIRKRRKLARVKVSYGVAFCIKCR